jgi:hypothetical protein
MTMTQAETKVTYASLSNILVGHVSFKLQNETTGTRKFDADSFQKDRYSSQ